MPDVVADASCIIVLDNAGLCPLLESLYGTILVSEEVAREFGHPLPEWIRREPVRDREQLRRLSRLMDLGEASTLALALGKPDPLAILDDLRARWQARALGLRFTGTLGVIVKAKEEGVIEAVEPVVARLKQRGFWVSEATEQQVLRLAGEA